MIKAFPNFDIILMDENGAEFDMPYPQFIPVIQAKMQAALTAAQSLGLLDEVQIMADIVAEMMNAERSNTRSKAVEEQYISAAVEMMTPD